MKLSGNVSAIALMLCANLLQGCGAAVVLASNAGITPLQIEASTQQSSVSLLQAQSQLQISAGTNAQIKIAFATTGGQPPYTWAVASGSLPGGLSLDQSGVLTGQALAPGTWDAIIAVHDAGSTAANATKPVHFAISAVSTSGLAIGTQSLASGQVGLPYSAAFQATGGTPSFDWSLASGSLPTGLVLAKNGTISGTPKSQGTYTFGASVVDSSSPAQRQLKTFSLTIANAPLAIATAGLPTGAKGKLYVAALNATGGTPRYNWTITSGALPRGITMDETTGVIYGIPTLAGTYTLNARVTDQSSPLQQVSKSLSITISDPAPPLEISTGTLSAGQTGSAYSTTLQATGGTPAYTWSLLSGSLPVGLRLSGNGTLSGVPTAPGTSAFAVAVTDSNSPSIRTTKGFSITIAPAPVVISSGNPPSAQSGSVYSATLQATGGTPGYSWSLTSGTLPAGLSLTSAGLISGTPRSAGTSTFAVAVADQSLPVQRQSKQLTLQVAAAPLQIQSTTIANGKSGSSYAASLQATGGTPGYSWSIVSGSLPSGLSLSAAGALSGIPKTPGNFSFTVAVADSGAPIQRQTKSYSISIEATVAPLTITTESLAHGQSGSSYSTTLRASGGTPAYSWSVASGSLPTGLSLSAGGVLSGIAKTSGTWNFAVNLSDTSSPSQHQTRTFSVTVDSVPLTLISTSLGAGQVGVLYVATLHATGGTPRYGWSIASGALPDGVTMDEFTGVIYGQPTTAGSFTVTFTVNDNSSPAQTQSRSFALVIGDPNNSLSISSSGLGNGSVGKSYAGSLNASGGKPSYTWSVASGSLPAGLSLAATSGVITGTPTAAGTFSFTVAASDSAATPEVKTDTVSIEIATGGYNTWYVRPDGGTRFSTRVPDGQCDGLSDTPYPGAGVNQHCAYKDFRYMWDDKSGGVGAGSWVIAGGDTVIIRGCKAGTNQSNASDPNCRLGWDAPTGTGDNLWCYAVGSYNCSNPAIPAGTASRHTRILGQNYAGCAVGGATNPRQYVGNLTQLFAGYSLQFAFNLRDTQYVDVQCIELTTHNGRCVTSGSPQYPRPCNRDQPLDDYALNGFTLNNKSSNILFQDVYVHGFNSSGFNGPLGGAVTMTRVYSGFNAFSGWNFDDGNDTPNAPGSSLTASYVTMIGNGCYEEYPVSHDFPAQACYDDQSGGFGDAWSGQDTDLDAFLCDHCVMAYNTKDAFIGPHTNVTKLTITNSQSYGNMGAQWKWNNTVGATTLFENNLTIGNCLRMNTKLPGAVQSFDQGTGLAGAYLSDYCRAGGNTVAINSQANSTVSFMNNTFVDYLNTVFLLSCGPNNQNRNKMCGTTPFILQNNVFLGYHLNDGLAPGLIYIDDPSVVVKQSNNIQFGNRPNHGEVCGSDGNVCADPALVNEPAQEDWTDQTFLDNFNFHPSASSPAIRAGVALAGMLDEDIFGKVRPAQPTIGAVEP